jgi:hypothetical protein
VNVGSFVTYGKMRVVNNSGDWLWMEQEILRGIVLLHKGKYSSTTTWSWKGARG